MFDVILLSSVLIGFIGFFWAATGAVKLMRINTRDRSRSTQAPFSEPFNALLMPGLGAEGLALRRRVWIGFFICVMCVVVAVTSTYWL